MRAAPSIRGSGALSCVARFSKHIAVILVSSGMLLTGGTALAGVGLGVTPVFPSTVRVGQTNVPADLVISWQNTPPNDTHGNIVTAIQITPSCGSVPAGSATCPPADVEAGTPTPISLSMTATGSADCRDPANPTVVPNPARQFVITPPAVPGGPWTITPDFFLPVNGTCILSFTINVNALPTKDASPTLSGLQTGVLAGAVANDAVDGAAGIGIGAALVGFPSIVTTPTPANGNLGPGPLNLSDSARITGLVGDAFNNPPTGTVTFRLFAPSDPTCTGPAFGTQTVNLNDPARCTITPITFETNCTTSNTFTVNAAGTWHWSADYSGDGLNVPLNSPCAAEPVQVGPATPTLATVPTPAPGGVGTNRNDSGQLNGGFQPYTGTITFNLFDPTQTNCMGVPRYTQTVAVSATGAATTSPGFPADRSGTWQWTASYSGDANNQPALSGCGAEPVVVPRPSLTIVKTPDGSTFAAGQNISFTISVTNTGPGIAQNVRLAPPDALPDPNSSLNWTVATQPAGNPCTVTGAAGAQLLNCNFGNLAQGATVSVTVTTPTQANDPGDCGNPLTLNNSATVIADNADPRTDTGSLACTPGQTTLVTTPIPATGRVGGAPLNDSGQLTGTAPFTGTITFNLFDPTQLNCTGVPRFTQTVPVTAAGTAQTTGGPVPNMSGTWQWTATYSGDANHGPATSGCGAEPVAIARPTLTIAKTPDAGTFIPGQTLTWTIAVTNSGPGTALGVMLSPGDALPDPNASLNWTVTTQPAAPSSCTITGAAGAQVLNCNFGDMPENTTRTVVVSTPTQVTDVGDCPAGVTLTNTARVIATNADPVTDTGTQTCAGRPTLTIVKTPDSGTYRPGDNVTFSIVVTNTGPGAATNVRLAPPDALPDPNRSLLWTIGTQPAGNPCNITGAPGSQVLNCNFGTMAQGAALTVTVTTATQINDIGDCGQPLLLSNTATVIGDNADPRTDTGSLFCDVPAMPVPTLSDLGLLLLIILFGATGCAILRRRVC